MNLVSTLSNTAISTYSSLETANTAASKTAALTTSVTTPPETTQQPKGTDQATFSNVALQLSQTTSSASSLFPARPGMSTSALIMAPANPGLATSSKGLTFADVATDARARMNDKYAQMEASGTPYDRNSYEGRDTNSLLGDLDRRSLYAVSNNKDGLFTKEEQQAATSAMSRQQGIAMGLYDSNAANAFTANPAKHYEAGLTFLNNVSPEEKGSAEWLLQHMNLEEGIAALKKEDKTKPSQTLFEMIAEMNSGQTREEEEEKPLPGASTASAQAPVASSSPAPASGATS
ncbi:hypothetical protein PSCICM_05330 [Pseudomonas cichorii]|uniref:hypothetical protein n=1 Tax=Pseudomonas cichorii TaxID=36746 RepID=UPI00190FFF53|nr:hypothetical protein [Pseudomonas cichorii]GFM74714.1 hypothetical protein PSCICM_05330 [Pseudomonas cichorii]